MALPEITEEDYASMGGRYDWERASESVTAAIDAVADAIWPNEPGDDDEDALKKAIIRGIDVDIAYGQSGGVAEGATSVRIGSFSASMGGSGSYRADMGNAIRRALQDTGLLYAGGL